MEKKKKKKSKLQPLFQSFCQYPMWQRSSWMGKPLRLILHLCSLFAEVSAKRMDDKKRKGRKMKKKKRRIKRKN
jgi:hypothetical protein